MFIVFFFFLKLSLENGEIENYQLFDDCYDKVIGLFIY